MPSGIICGVFGWHAKRAKLSVKIDFFLINNLSMFAIRHATRGELVNKMAIISDMTCDYRHARALYGEYCAHVYKYCGEKYNLCPVELIGGTPRDLLAVYAQKCPDVHVNPSEYTGDSKQLCDEIYDKYGETCRLPNPQVLRWSYETLATWYISELPYQELVSLGI
jgi:hypothetical protein